MMNSAGGGESSCKGQEDGDATTGSERPLKKARFAWQVKGKYRMKDETIESTPVSTALTVDSSSSNAAVVSDSTETLRNGVKDYLTKHDHIQSGLETDKPINTPATNAPNDKPQYPRYFSSSSNTSNNSSCRKIGTSSSYVSIAKILEDDCIVQWQATQIIKCTVDNAINRILESWSNDPLAGDDNISSRFLAHNRESIAEFINHLPSDNSVENEGILMAISAHGLQNTSGTNSDINIHPNTSTSNTPGESLHIPSPLRSSTPTSQSDFTNPSNLKNTEEGKSNDGLDNICLPWNCSDTSRLKSDETSFTCFSDPPQSPYNLTNNLNSNPEYDEDSDSHLDFMNAAVLYAIQSKGLTTTGTDYG